MELVWKKNARGRFERKLNLAEKEALLHVFSIGRKPGQADLRIVNMILDEMDRQELWIKCDWTDPTPVDKFCPHDEACSKASGLTPPRWLWRRARL